MHAVKEAITSYVNWINSVGITGYGVYNIADRTRELGTDRLNLKGRKYDKAVRTILWT